MNKKYFKRIILILSLLYFVSIPALVLASMGYPCSNPCPPGYYQFETGIPFLFSQCQCVPHQNYLSFINNFIKTKLFPLAGFIGFLVFIYAGFEYALSGGDQNKQKDAQNKIQNVLIGIALLFLMWVILYIINPDILKTQEPTLKPVNSPSVSTSSTTSATLAQFIATAKNFANPYPEVEIKIITKPDAQYCQITTRTERGTSTKTIPFQYCLYTYPYVNKYWNALPNTYKDSTYSYGMSCDIYVATVLRTAGIDPNYPYTNATTQYDYIKNHPEKYECVDNNNNSLNQNYAKNGSILFYDLNGNGEPDHVALWIDGQRWQASQGEYFPMNRGSAISGSGFPLMAICNFKNLQF
ncbi:MAG: pilin [Minisyncoccia bacterium]